MNNYDADRYFRENDFPVSKIAGVTFRNSNGESRQEILKNLGFGWKLADLKQTTFNGERAVEVWIDGKHVGYIPKTDLNSEFSHYAALDALILYYEEKDIYYAELYKPKS